MECDQCGQHSDYVGERSKWKALVDPSATRALYECQECGHQQRSR